jgi:hypothetical protein
MTTPWAVVAAVTWHHDPDQSRPEHRVATQLVHLADFACVNQSIGDTIEGLYDGFSLGAWHDLGLSANELSVMLVDLKDEIDRADNLGGVKAA